MPWSLAFGDLAESPSQRTSDPGEIGRAKFGPSPRCEKLGEAPEGETNELSWKMRSLWELRGGGQGIPVFIGCGKPEGGAGWGVLPA